MVSIRLEKGEIEEQNEMTWEIVELCLPAAHSVKCVSAQMSVFFLNNCDFQTGRAVFFSQQGRLVIMVIIAVMYVNQALKLISFKMFG